MSRFWQKTQEGFTLVELMVVVAIIGVLSAVAVPNFKKYQAKSKTSEAKLQLSAAYTALQSFNSDYDTYHVCLRYMGYNPTNEAQQRIYSVGFGDSISLASFTGASCDVSSGVSPSDLACANGALVGAGVDQCNFAATANSTYFMGLKRTGAATPLATFTAADVGAVAPTTTTFVVGAVGIVDVNNAAANTASAFNINQAKKLNQFRAGY